jgi:hypothetical protein
MEFISISSLGSPVSEYNIWVHGRIVSGPAIADNVPIVFGDDSSDQFNSILLEDHETLPKPPEPYQEGRPSHLGQELRQQSTKHAAVTQFLGICLLVSFSLIVIFRRSFRPRILANRRLSDLRNQQ